MRTIIHFTLSLLFALGLAETTFGQRAKLEGQVFDGNNVARPNVKVLIVGGQETTTVERGYFSTILPDVSFSPGKPVTIHVNGWKVFDPIFGHCIAQDASLKNVYVRVTIIPPNWIAAHKDRRRLSAIVEEYAKEAGGLSAAVRDLQNELTRKNKNLAALTDRVNKLDEELGKYAFLRRYSEEYEVPLEEIKAAIDDWAVSKKADSDLERARQAYWRGDEAEVLKLTRSILDVKTRFAKLRREETLKENAKLIEAAGLRAGVFSNQRNLRETYATFKNLAQLFEDRTISKEDFPEDWAKAQLGVGFSALLLRMSMDLEGRDRPVPADKYRKDLVVESLTAMRNAEGYFTPKQSLELWMIMKSLSALASAYEDTVPMQRGSGDITRLSEARTKLRAVLAAVDESGAMVKSEKFPTAWFMMQSILGGVLVELADRTHGADSIGFLREALSAQESGLNSLDREKSPSEWAKAQNDLTYVLITLGHQTYGEEGRRHLRRATEASRAVLEATRAGAKVYTPEKFPDEWLSAQNTLAFVLTELARQTAMPESVEHLRGAAAAYRAVLEAGPAEKRIFTPEKFPAMWASTQRSLASVLVIISHLTGESGHLRDAIKMYDEILSASQNGVKIFTPEQYPREWATSQSGIASALLELGRQTQWPAGIEHVREAVAKYKVVSSDGGITPEKLPVEWALNQTSLAIALVELAQQTGGPDGLEHLREAVKAYKEFLEARGAGGQVYTPERDGEGWAGGQLGLGGVYMELGQWTAVPESVEHLRGAAAAYRAVLEAGPAEKRIFTPESAPQEWSSAQNGLGKALIELSRRTEGATGVEQLREAVKTGEAVLEARRAGAPIYTPEQFPYVWAWAQINMAMASGELSLRVGGADSLSYTNKLRALANAVLDASHAGEKIYTPARFPAEWSTARHLIAESYVAQKRWTEARDAYAGILQVFPDDAAAYQKLGWLYHEILFTFDKSFDLQQQWLARHPDDLASQTDFAESYFTVARFPECGQYIARLLTNPNVPPDVKTALSAIEIANLLALDQDGQVPAKLEALIDEVRQQPVSFHVIWSFDGTRYFIAHNEKLKPHRAWLGQLFEAFKAEEQDALLKALLETQARLKRRLRQPQKRGVESSLTILIVDR
jgi:tetratricopeptide (TPR) repeat protein